MAKLCRFSLDAGQLISGAHGIHKDKRTNGDIITVSLTLSIVMAFCRKLERDIYISGFQAILSYIHWEAVSICIRC